MKIYWAVGLTVEIETYSNPYFISIPEPVRRRILIPFILMLYPFQRAKQGAVWGKIKTTSGKHLVESFRWNRPPESGPCTRSKTITWQIFVFTTKGHILFHSLSKVRAGNRSDVVWCMFSAKRSHQRQPCAALPPAAYLWPPSTLDLVLAHVFECCAMEMTREPIGLKNHLPTRKIFIFSLL